MERNKTLVIITPAFPANERESYWVPSQQLMVKALQKNYPQIHFFVLTFFYPYQETSYLWNGVDTTSFNGIQKRKLRRIFLWRSAWKKLKDIHNKFDIIGILSFWCGECAFIGHHFAKRHSLKHLTWICGQDARKTNRWVRFIHPASQELVAMSPFLVREFYKSHGIMPPYIIPNAVDPAIFHHSIPSIRDIQILAVGSFEPLKQYDVFVRIIHALKEYVPHIQAVHCGLGREDKKIDELINMLGLQKNVQLSGGKPHEEILELMCRTKVFLHTSRYEGFSTVCLEALYAGAHVISFCYPLDHAVPHWHRVDSEGEMMLKALEILNIEHPDHSPVFLYSMDECAKKMMDLFEKGAVPNDTEVGDHSVHEQTLNSQL